MRALSGGNLRLRSIDKANVSQQSVIEVEHRIILQSHRAIDNPNKGLLRRKVSQLARRMNSSIVPNSKSEIIKCAKATADRGEYNVPFSVCQFESKIFDATVSQGNIVGVVAERSTMRHTSLGGGTHRLARVICGGRNPGR